MNRNLSDRWHGPFWLGCGILAVLPFIVAIGFGWPRAPWVSPPGFFGSNFLRAIWWGLGGAAFGGFLWLKLSGRSMIESFRGWWKEKHQFHWMWFIFSVSIFGLHNHLVLDGFPFSGFEKLSAMFGRVLTGAVVVGLCWLACGLAGGVAPRRMRRWPWVVAACLPFVILADYLSIIVWKNPILNILNQLDGAGTFDLGANLASSGVAVPPWLVVVGCLAAVWGIYFLCHWLAERKWASTLKFRRWVLAVFLLGLWGGVWAEKLAGQKWKSRNALRWEHNSYQIHITPGLTPPLGVAEFKVEFFPKPLLKETDAPAPETRRPDVFIIMLESLRQDAIAPAHAPFLSRFRDQECQQIGTTWASSNSTALSWYGLFHGVLPVHWAGEKAKYAETEFAARPAWFDLLKKSGYRIEVRTVCDLSYRNMGATSFGSEAEQFTAFDQSPEGEVHWEDYYDQIPEREQKSFANAIASLHASPSHGNFHFIALDSTHFGYRWPENFEVPYADHYDGSGVPTYPNEEEIASVKRRYHNSVSWVDYQIEQFVHELKAMNRYEDSLIIVTGDHGEEFYENGSWFHSSSLLPAQTQVPLLIKWPEGVEAPAQASASHLDLLPSLRDLLKLPKDPSLPGSSLLKSIETERTQISFACNTGITGVCMAWYRNGWVATFRWKNPFSHEPPSEIHLDDIIGPEGSELTLVEPEAWKELLLEKFPDAPGRLFTNFELSLESE